MNYKEIKDYPNYYVSDTGLVINKKTNRVLKKSFSDKEKRYYRVPLSKDGIKKHFLIHRLVAEAFCYRKEGCNVVHHLDNNGLNNNVNNLVWTTQSHNVKQAYNDGLIRDRKGENNPNFRNGKYVRSNNNYI